MKGLFSSSPCPWQNSLQSQWEQDYPANISVTNRASLKSVFWHWRESFITMHHCKLYQGGSSSLPSSLSVSSSNIAADRHTRDMAGKQWEMLFHWQRVTRWVCICFCLLPMKYYWPECAIKEREPSAVKPKNLLQELQGHLKNSPFLSLRNGTPGQLCSNMDQSSLIPWGRLAPWQEFCWHCWKLQFDWCKLMSLPVCCSPAADLCSCWISLCFLLESNSFRHLPQHGPNRTPKASQLRK